MPKGQSSSGAIGATVVVSVLVLIGLGDLPYGFFMLLRLATCVVALYLIFGASLSLDDWHKWALAAVALLYNPIIPVHLMEKSIWIIVNAATLVLFWAVSVRPASPSNTAESGQV